MEAHPDVGVEGLMKGAELLTRPAESFGNDPAVEMIWAKKAFEHAETYFEILRSVDSSLLKLTPQDDYIYEEFRKFFPDLRVAIIDKDELKSEAGKKKWREFSMHFKDKVEDYSFGTLLRQDCTGEYSEDNSIVVSRIQFLAIEIARNKGNLNNLIRSKYSLKENEKE